jgi:hypothetical protein
MENRLFRPKMGHLSHQRSNSIMNCLIKLSISLSLLNLVPLQVSSSGVFEFRLISFINELSRDAVGNCCGSGYRVENNIEICSEKCQTFFRVCLKHYQTNIDPSPPCTFGEVTTKAFNDSSVIIKDNALNGLDYTIRFPFNFSWPGTFSLIVEAWHNASSSWTSSRASTKTTTRSLITRLAMSRYLKVDSKWTQKSAHNNQSTLNYSYRVMCQENYFGEYCGALCKPRDDNMDTFPAVPKEKSYAIRDGTETIVKKQFADQVVMKLMANVRNPTNANVDMDGKVIIAIIVLNIQVVFMVIVSNHGIVYVMKDGVDFFAIKI